MRCRRPGLAGVFGALLVAFASGDPACADQITVGPLPYTSPWPSATFSLPYGSYTQSFPRNQLTIDFMPVALQVPRFDPTLGTLTSVTLDLESDPVRMITDTFVVQPSVSPSHTVTFGNQVALAGPSGTLLSGTASTTLDLSGVSNLNNFPVVAWTGAASLSTTLTAPLDLAAFIGTGDLELDAMRRASAFGTPATETHTRITDPGDFTGALTVVYNFRAVPEPGSLALATIGAATLALGCLRGRRG